MPHCYQINDDQQEIAKTNYKRSDFQLPEKKFIYSSFNDPYKIDIKTFKAWINILKRTKNSVLWLMGNHKSAMKNIKDKAKELGINPRRIIFAPRLPKPNHLARTSLSDLALDTFICNGHTSQN